MKFLVMNRDQMKDYKCEDNHIIISIKDPGSSDIEIVKRKNRADLLRLSFHDLDRPYFNYKVFSKREARYILDFINYNLKHIDVIICQCEAGISRSAGVAGALSKIINGDDTAIFRDYLPNSLVYRTIIEEAYERGFFDV